MDLIVVEDLKDPEDMYGLHQVLLEKVGTGEHPPVFLVSPSPPHVGVTRADRRMARFPDALKNAGEAGFPVLERRSGGGTVAANAGTLVMSLIQPVKGTYSIYKHYAEAGDLITAALGRLGVKAEAGEVEDEFCPGAYSIRWGGRQGMKLAGLAQRVTRRAARLDALILVSDTVELAYVLKDFYNTLGLPFRPGSVGSLDRAGSPSDTLDVIGALSLEARKRYGAREVPLDKTIMLLAQSHRGEYRISPEDLTGHSSSR